jgi:DNA-binding MarR family transcriptional regulator
VFHCDGLAPSVVVVAHLFEQRLVQALRPLHISMRQYMALRIIEDNPFVSRVGLARLLRVSPQAVGGLTNRLAEAGLLGWAPHGPGAPKHYQLTPAGTDRVAKAREVMHCQQQMTVEAMYPSVAKCMNGAMQELLKTLVLNEAHLYHSERPERQH